jgi:hypothetical protein
MMNDSGEILLRRDELARRLQAAGFPITYATLETLACRGGGPKFCRFGRYVLYRWEDALSWAKSRLTDTMSNTSDLKINSKDPDQLPLFKSDPEKFSDANMGSGGITETIPTATIIRQRVLKKRPSPLKGG